MKLDRRTLLKFDARRGALVRDFGRPPELRAAGEGSDGRLTFEGYASVTMEPYEMYGGPPYGWNEIVQRGAFRRTLASKPDVQFLINHEGMPLARTANAGNLGLEEDEIGLLTRGLLNPADRDVQQLQVKMDDGLLDQMSFAGWFMKVRWEDESGEEADPMTAPVRRVLEIKLHRGDVSIVNQGANEATAGSTLRNLDEAFTALRSGGALSKEQRHTILVALGDIELDESMIDDSGADTWNDNEVETETENEPAAGANSALPPAAVRAYVAAGRKIPTRA